MPTPLPFPELPDELVRIMARQPNAPHMVRGLWERASGLPCVNGLLSVEDVLQSLQRLRALDMVYDDTNRINGVEYWKLTTRGKLSAGVS